MELQPELELKLPADMAEIIKGGKYLPMVKVLFGTYTTPEESRMAMLQALGVLDGYEIGKALGAGNRKQRAALADDTGILVAAQLIDFVFPAIEFIYEGEPFYDNPMPELKHKGISYAGPGTRLYNQTAEEWMICHQLQYRYGNSNDIAELRRIAAAIYHPVQNGHRSTFSEAAMAANEASFADLPDDVIHGIYLWYKHCDNWWPMKFPHLFAEDGEGDGGGEPGNGFEVRHIVFELSGSSIGGEWDIVKHRTRQEVFYALDRMDEKRQAVEDANEK